MSGGQCYISTIVLDVCKDSQSFRLWYSTTLKELMTPQEFICLEVPVSQLRAEEVFQERDEISSRISSKSSCLSIAPREHNAVLSQFCQTVQFSVQLGCDLWFGRVEIFVSIHEKFSFLPVNQTLLSCEKYMIMMVRKAQLDTQKGFSYCIFLAQGFP